MEYKLTTNVINPLNTIQTVYSKEHRPQLKSDKNRHRTARSKIENNILFHLIERAPPSNHQINNCQYSTNVSLPEKQYIANKQYVDDNSKDCFHCLATKKKKKNRKPSKHIPWIKVHITLASYFNSTKTYSLFTGPNYTANIQNIIIYMKKFLDYDWPKEMQFLGNTVRKKSKLVQKRVTNVTF